MRDTVLRVHHWLILIGGLVYGAIYTGLLYPIAVCLVTLVVGGLFIRETRGHRIDADTHF